MPTEKELFREPELFNALPFSDLLSILGLDPNFDFIGEFIEGAEFCDERVTGVDFTGAHFVGGSFSKTQFYGCRFVDATFADVAVCDSRFVDCDFSNATLIRGAWESIEFEKSNLSSVRLFDVAALNGSVVDSILMRADAKLKKLTETTVDLPKSTMKHGPIIKRRVGVRNDLLSSPGHLLRRAQQYAQDVYAREVGPNGPTPRQFEILHTISQREGLSQSDLVRATGIDRSTMADMIARMISKGILSRSRTAGDARANAVKLTTVGRRVLASAMSKVQRAEKAALSVLPVSQQVAFMRALQAYNDALDEVEFKGRSLPREVMTAPEAKKKLPAKRAFERSVAGNRTASRRIKRKY